ncbi:serine protease [Sutcliffiella sp. NPDC057660]|uniref:S1 family peptidase n=1 Tax=Sutcliffiella sp. NPDC057660 TaxID=3346199 RepID=UPI0036C0A01D
MDFSSQFEQIKDSVVNVLVLDQNQQIVSSGTGVLVGEGNKVVTCSHCLLPNLKNGVRFSGSNNFQLGNIIFNDPVKDIAILEFSQPLGKGVVIRNSDNIKIGKEAFVVGFPSKIMEITALFAHVAGFSPTNNGFDLIRIDSSVNHGNSGGPLFNHEGELIGIVNAKHGSLSAFLREVQQAQATGAIFVGSLDPVKAIQELIKEMQQNLNLGIGYAIPINEVGKSYSPISELIQN